MSTNNVQDTVERALEMAIETLDIIATDNDLDRRFRDTQDYCNQALIDLRGYGHEIVHDDWKSDSEN